MLGYNKNYTILFLNCMLNNSKKTISVLKIERSDGNNSIKRKYTNNIYLQMLSLVNILLNSQPYTV